MSEWCQTSAPDEVRSIVVTVTHTANLGNIKTVMRNAGADIQSEGRAAIVMAANSAAARTLSTVDGVVRMTMPERLQPKSN
ncbi:MAG: hypothetical protein AAF513_18425 [Pseudomonadota bacterium]